jgi:hypothetical protein
VATTMSGSVEANNDDTCCRHMTTNQSETVFWSWLHCAESKVNAEYSSYRTLNSGKQENKTEDMSWCWDLHCWHNFANRLYLHAYSSFHALVCKSNRWLEHVYILKSVDNRLESGTGTGSQPILG